MAKKKTSSKEQEEKPKPIDRTPIIVAIIGLVGTITVTLITVFANRPAETRSYSGGVDESGVIPAAVDTNTSQSNETCFDDHFSSIPADHRLELQGGISTRLPSSEDGTYGVRLFNNGTQVGGIQFIGSSGTQSFNVISVVDTNCSPVTGFGNLERPAVEGAISNWENLGFSIAGVDYRLRMGWYGSNQIELIFQED